MQLSTIVAIASAAVCANAVPTPPPGQCVVKLGGTPYNQLSIRPTPCNNQQPLANLNNGQFVTDLHKTKSGCGFTYNYVGYYAPNGKYIKGWVGSDYVYCPSNPPSPQPSAIIKCGAWAVQRGGGDNACGDGKSFTASDSDTCNGSDRDCKSQCCTGLVFRRDGAQLCGKWSLKNGGPDSACGDGFAYTAEDDDVCNQSGKNCVKACCSPVQQQLCSKGSVKNGGGANACGDDYSYTAEDDDVCNKSGKNCVKACCSPLVFSDN